MSNSGYLIKNGWRISLALIDTPEKLYQSPETELKRLGYVFEPHLQVTHIRRVDQNDETSGKLVEAVVIPETHEGMVVRGIHLGNVHIKIYKPARIFEMPKTILYAFGLHHLSGLKRLKLDKETTGPLILEKLPGTVRRFLVPPGVELVFTQNGSLRYNNSLDIESFLSLWNSKNRNLLDSFREKGEVSHHYVFLMMVLNALNFLNGRKPDEFDWKEILYQLKLRVGEGPYAG